MSKRLPPRVEDPLAILDSVKAGERCAIEKMVEGHLRLAAGLVARFYRSDTDSDELVSAAFYAVANAVQRIADGHLTHDNPTAYIVMFVTGELRRTLANKSISVKTIPLNHHVGEWNTTRSEITADDRAIANIIGNYPDTTIDIEEEINALNKIDARIVELLRLGYKNVEIADDLKIDKSNVSRRVHRIRKIFRELENE